MIKNKRPAPDFHENLGEVICRYDYTWLAKHRNTKFLMMAPVMAIAINIFFMILSGREMSFDRPEILIYLVIGCTLVGIVIDHFGSLAKKFKPVLVGKEGLQVGDAGETTCYVKWIDVITVDEFNINSTSTSYKSDYTDSLGIGGVRILDTKGKKFIFYKSLRNFDELMTLLVESCVNAKYLKK